MKTKAIKYIIFILGVIALNVWLVFKPAFVKANHIGIVFSNWDGKTIKYLPPGDHLIFRLYGFTNADSSIMLIKKLNKQHPIMVYNQQAASGQPRPMSTHHRM
jgi:hypothetical protein